MIRPLVDSTSLVRGCGLTEAVNPTVRAPRRDASLGHRLVLAGLIRHDRHQLGVRIVAKWTIVDEGGPGGELLLIGSNGAGAVRESVGTFDRGDLELEGDLLAGQHATCETLLFPWNAL